MGRQRAGKRDRVGWDPLRSAPGVPPHAPPSAQRVPVSYTLCTERLRIPEVGRMQKAARNGRPETWWEETPPFYSATTAGITPQIPAPYSIGAHETGQMLFDGLHGVAGEASLQIGPVVGQKAIVEAQIGVD